TDRPDDPSTIDRRAEGTPLIYHHAITTAAAQQRTQDLIARATADARAARPTKARRSPQTRWLRPDRAAAAGNDSPGHSWETSHPQEATEQDARLASATSRRTTSKRASTSSGSRSMQPPP